jgi:uncharacterized membrane protein
MRAERVAELDALRGLAIIMMVGYHIVFDIYYFGFAAVDLQSLPILLFQRATGSLFIVVAGIALTLSEGGNRDGYARHAVRALRLAAVALLITAGTWIYPHEGFITFGIIHFLALSTLLAPFFLRFGRLNFVLGLAVIALGLFTAGLTTSSHYLFWLGLLYPGYTALDYYPLLPWFGMMLIGLAAGGELFPGGKPLVRLPDGRALRRLAFMGRHSLLIYLLHQPVLVGIALLWKTLMP